MNSMMVTLITAGCVSGGLAGGLLLRRWLPQHHLQDDSRDAVKTGAGMVATLTALVLGLLVTSAKNSFDTLNNGVIQAGAKSISLDRVLAQYGPETQETRDLLRRTIASVIGRVWPEEGTEFRGLPPLDPGVAGETIHGNLLRLSPHNDSQRVLQAEALQLSTDLGRTRWQMIEQGEASLPAALLVVLIIWLTILFASFGLLAPPNSTSISVLLLCALSVTCAIFLMVEMNHPTTGILQVQSGPLVKAYELLGR